MEEQNIKKLALILTANCIQQSTIEECQKKGQINEQQFNQINREMSDRIYTFLTYLLQKPANEYTSMLEAMAQYFPENQPMPELSQFILQQSKTAGPAATI